MQFTVPQFIEQETKIVGPLTFRQFIYIGGGGIICFILYFTLAKNNFWLFVLVAIILMSIALAFAFLKIGGRSLTTILLNFFTFTIAPKIYLWRRKSVPPRIIERIEKRVEPGKTSPLKFADKSQLKKLSVDIETKT